MYRRVLALLFCVFFVSANVVANPAPKDILGFTPGDDYKLASWAKVVEYFQKLDASSDRMVFKEIGKSTNGKPFTYALISSPENLRKLDYYKDINDKLADPRKIKRSMREAKKLVKQGKELRFDYIWNSFERSRLNTLFDTCCAQTRFLERKDESKRS